MGLHAASIPTWGLRSNHAVAKSHCVLAAGRNVSFNPAQSVQTKYKGDVIGNERSGIPRASGDWPLQTQAPMAKHERNFCCPTPIVYALVAGGE